LQLKEEEVEVEVTKKKGSRLIQTRTVIGGRGMTAVIG